MYSIAYFRRELRFFDISVHIIEPGFFRTAITDPMTITQGLKKSWDRLPDDIRNQYGPKYVAEG